MENEKEVRFDKYCDTCKHNDIKTNDKAGTYNGTSWSGVTTKEEYEPCCDCIETAAREETEVPINWEAK